MALEDFGPQVGGSHSLETAFSIIFTWPEKSLCLFSHTPGIVSAQPA